MPDLDEPDVDTDPKEHRDRARRASLLGIGLGLTLSALAKLHGRRSQARSHRSRRPTG